MSESTTTVKMCRALELCGAQTFAVVGGTRQRSGWPDRYLHHRLWHGWLEAKGPSTGTAAIQRHTLSELNRRRPGSAYLVRYSKDRWPCDLHLVHYHPDRTKEWDVDVPELCDGKGIALAKELLCRLNVLSQGMRDSHYMTLPEWFYELLDPP